jgi:ubiquinone/menaquinone biosynthesis C-methylase UbiE
MNSFIYDEYSQVGVDYNSVEEVRRYDDRMRQLRDVAGEAAQVLAQLSLGSDAAVIDMGAGTGEFALAAARSCARVYAVDVSEPMLRHASQKASERGIDNVEFIRAGFLTYQHEGGPVDAVVSQLALHHLPDFWKGVALRKVWDLLKPGGQLYVHDVVFPTGTMETYREDVPNWLADTRRRAGDEFASRICAHVREQYSTYDWVMEGLLRAAGFTARSADSQAEFFATYLCTRDGG